jgi:hypothetical protein
MKLSSNYTIVILLVCIHEILEDLSEVINEYGMLSLLVRTRSLLGCWIL